MPLDLRYDSDGRAFSPVVCADSKFFGFRGALCVDVRFESTEQLDVLIEALIKLRDFPPNGYNHVHLQDRDPHSDGVGAEVTFWHPSVQRGEADELCVKDACETIDSIPPVERFPRGTGD